MSTQPCSYARMLLLKAMDPPLMQHPSTFLDCDTFEKQVVHLLGCSLDTVTRQQYDDLVSQSESTWPCHQQSFIKSVKEYIRSFRSNVQPNSNVQPSSVTSVATSATIPDDSDHVCSHSDACGDPAETSTQLSDDIHQSLPTSKPNPAPTCVPAPLAAQKYTSHPTYNNTCSNSVVCYQPTSATNTVLTDSQRLEILSAHSRGFSWNQWYAHYLISSPHSTSDDVSGDPVPCRQPTPTIRAVPTDSHQPAPSASLNSMYQLNQHIENQRSTAIGSLRFELPQRHRWQIFQQGRTLTHRQLLNIRYNFRLQDSRSRILQ